MIKIPQVYIKGDNQVENETIEDLVEQYNSQPSDELFDEIFQRTYMMGFKKFRKLLSTGMINEPDALQLIRLATFRATQTYSRIKAKFSTWLYYYYNDEIFDYCMERNIIRKPDYLMWKKNRTKIQSEHPEYYLDTISLDIPLLDDSDDTLLSSLADDGPGPDKIIETTTQREYLLSLVKKLPPRQSHIISEYFGLEDGIPKTLQTLGNKHGVTRERIRQIIKSGLIRLKRKIQRDDITD